MIASLDLAPLPEEGGWFRQTWRSPLEVGGRPAGTAILALFTATPDGFSALHRLDAPEVWHFYRGADFELLLLHPDGDSGVVVLGPGGAVQHVVPAGTWMGGAPRDAVGPGGWSLLGATMAPGFVESGFELGVREQLAAAYPTRRAAIERLTRPAPRATRRSSGGLRP